MLLVCTIFVKIICIAQYNIICSRVQGSCKDPCCRRSKRAVALLALPRSCAAADENASGDLTIISPTIISEESMICERKKLARGEKIKRVF